MSSTSSPSSSYLDSALEFPKKTFPSRASSHSASASLESPKSLYVTFKVLQLVNQFRKRVQTRVQSSGARSKQSSSRLTEDFCQAFEREAAEHIDYVLGKTRVRPARKTPYPDCTRRSLHKRKVSKRSSVKVATTAKPETDSTTAKKIEWLLKALDKSVKSENHSLTEVAKSHGLFVGRKEDFTIEHNSWKELLPQLVRITSLLDTLRRAPSSKAGVKTFAESDEAIDLSFDENIVANLEHLLLCLKEQLIRLLIAELRELVRTHVLECQRNQRQHTKELILEYPDGQHPLSTTWPWSIRPSLAVLWGVCWMFKTYIDHNGDMRDDSDNRLVYSAQQLQEAIQSDDPTENESQEEYYPPHFQGGQHQNQNLQHQSLQNQNQNQNLQHQNLQHQGIYQQGNYGHDLRPRSSPSDLGAPRTDNMQAHHSPVMTLHMAQPQYLQHLGGQNLASSHPFSAAPDQAANPGPTAFRSNNAFSAAPPAYPAPQASVHPNSLPQVYPSNFNNPSSGSPFISDESGLWVHAQPVQGQQPEIYYAPSTLPPHSAPPAAAFLSLDTSNLQARHPQDFNPNSATPVSATSSHHGSRYGQNLSPLDARARVHYPMNSVEQPEQQPYTTPKSESPAPQHQTVSAYPYSRKRSHETMTMAEAAQEQHHSRNGSQAGSEGGYPVQHPSGDEQSPGRTRLNQSVNRPDPPQNKEGKYICNYSQECQDHVFDRKCEWNKHMDKHDRPYRCPHPDCAKLQGFTYSGGLLRHEREVHNKHGGPKTQLMCHYADCKRKNKGFTRKENLNEHIRRVHSKEAQQSQDSMKRNATEMSAIAGALQEDAESPYPESGITQEDSLVSPTHQAKRRRIESNGDGLTEMEHLKRDNEALQMQLASMGEEMQQLRNIVHQLQQAPVEQHGAPGQG